MNSYSLPKLPRLISKTMLLAASASTLQAAPIEFLESEGFTTGVLDGQQGWVTSTANFATQLNATAGTVSSQNGEVLVLNTPVNLAVGETYTYTATFQFVDFTESGLTPPAAEEFWYLLKTGLKETNETVGIGDLSPSGITKLQAFEDNVRLLDNAYAAGTAGGTGSALALATPYTISYSLTLGADAESSNLSISLSDGVATASGTINGISTSLHDDLTSGDGAYMFFQTQGVVQGGIDAVQLLTVDINGGTTPPPSSNLIEFLATEGFTTGVLDGQQGWVTSAANFGTQLNATAGTVASQNGEVLIYDTPVNLAVGESFTYATTFQFVDFTDSGLTPPAAEEFWYLLKTGLKETNEVIGVGDLAPSGITKFQAFENGVRLLDNAYGAGTAGGTSSPLALALPYTVGYTLTLGADAASSEIMLSLNDGTETVSGTITGISASLFDDLTTGDGAYMFFQTQGVVQGGIDAVQLLSVEFESGGTPPPAGSTLIDFLAAEGFVDGVLNGQQGWTISPANFGTQLNATSGLVSSQNAEVLVLDTPYNLTVGETLSFSAVFQFVDFTDSGLVPPGAEEFWYLLKTGLKESGEAIGVGDLSPSGITKLQAFEDNVRLLDNAYAAGTAGGTGSALALETTYTIGYSLTLGNDAASSEIFLSLSDGSSTATGTLTGISSSLYDDLSSGDGAHLFFQTQGVVQGGIDAVQLDSISITAPSGGTVPDGITITSITYEPGVGPTINYTSTVGPVDVYVNETGSVLIDDFDLLASGETGGSFTDDGVTADKAFYILTSEGEEP